MILKSNYDTREYESFELQNGLQIIIISDKNTEKSYASMVVNVGYYNDSVPGIAHFLEHMLFMGSKKYRGENDYQAYLSEHGGYSNAYTTSDHTCYYFNILNKYFIHMLDIFGNFFIDPLLNESSVNREMNAVDSEYRKNILSDSWRLLDIVRDIIKKTNPSHPMGKFGTGALETLNVPNILSKLKDFYEQFYHANNYKLVILHNDSLNNIKNLVTEIFSKIRSKSHKNILSLSMPFVKTNKIQIIPIKKINELVLCWQTPRDSSMYKIKPLNYLNYVISNTSKGTPCYFLKEYGYCSDIIVDTLDEGGNICLFGINISLTKKGYKYRDHIIELFLILIDKIKIHGINETIYNERNAILFNNFNHTEKTDMIKFITDISVNMLSYNPEHCVALDIVNEPYSINVHDTILEYITNYINKKNMNIFDISKRNKLHNIIKSKWMNAEYANRTKNKLLKSSTIIEYTKYYLQSKNVFGSNIFVPKIMTIVTDEKKNKIISINNDGYYLFDGTRRLPLVYIGIVITNDNINNNIQNYEKTQIIVKIMKKIIDIDLYDAYILGYIIHLSVVGNKIILKIGCHVDVILKLLNICINILFKLENTKIKQYFKQIKNLYIKSLKNYKYLQPYNHVLNNLELYYSDKLYRIKDRLKCVNKIELSELYNNNLFDKYKLNYLIYGNIININDIVNIIPKSNTDKINISTLNIPDKSYMKIYKNLYNKEINSAIVVSFYLGNYKPKSDESYLLFCLGNILYNYLQEPFFDQLRTVQQLGYIVKSKLSLYGNYANSIMSYDLFIQSPLFKSKKLKKRILSFIDSIHIDENKFVTYLESCKTDIIKKNDTSLEDFSYNLEQIKKETYNFDFKNYIYSKYSEITFDIFNEFFLDKIKKNPITIIIGTNKLI